MSDMEQLEYRFKLFDFTFKKNCQNAIDCAPPKIDQRTSCNNDYLVSYACENTFGSIVLTNMDDDLRMVSSTVH